VVALVIDDVSEHEGRPKWGKGNKKKISRTRESESRVMRLLITLDYVIFD